MRCFTGELCYRFVSKAFDCGTALLDYGRGLLLGNCYIGLWVRRVNGEMCYRIMGETCYLGTPLKNCE